MGAGGYCVAMKTVNSLLRGLCGAVIFLGAAVWAQEDPSAFDLKLKTEEGARSSPWFIEPHRPSYVLPVSYIDHPSLGTKSGTGEIPAEATEGSDEKLQHVEVKFQFSFRLSLAQDLFADNGDLYAAYTQVSVWQAYNADNSSPFRDTNYEPELFLAFDTDYDLFGLHGRMVTLGAVHQSNGRGTADLSRSWNRIYANVILERGNFVCNFKPWWRIPEDEEEDNNPDIADYLGYGEFRAAYKWKNQVFATMLRNNLQLDENRGAMELDWSFPMVKQIRGFVQYFNGYGEVLLNYNERVQRIGVGFLLADWL
jgi:phospholipase A1